MVDIDILEITSGYSERMRRLALFEPLIELERKREHDASGNVIDMKGLGLLTLLFFFEQKLIRHYKTGVKQLAEFVQNITMEQYALDEVSCETLARAIITTFRPTTGKKRSYVFYDWEEKKESTIEYSILKANNFDLKTKTQYYTLDDNGLELLFATKEFYSEFQLSINQLMLRKQIEKGEFQGALRQINEMLIDVENLEERMEKLNHEIQRSIVSEETFERYKNLLEDIYARLHREDEEFKELRYFVKETREHLYSKDTQQKEQRSYELILKVNKELEFVHNAHSKLLDKTMLLRNTTLVTAQESLYYTGMQAFNFDQDIVSTIISAPLSVEAMKGILHPFLKIEENPSWSLLTVLADQNITEEREEKDKVGFLETDELDTDNVYRSWLVSRFRYIMEQYLIANEKGFGNTLSDFTGYLLEMGQSALLEERYFYQFWLVLHQRSPIIKGETDESDGQTILGDALRLLEHRQMIVKEKEKQEIVKLTERYSIQDMEIVLEDAVDELS